MLPEDKIIFEEENPVSLQKAFVVDDGYFLSLVLCPPQEHSIPVSVAHRRYISLILCRRRRAFWTYGMLLPLGSLQKQLISAAESLPKWPSTKMIGYLWCRLKMVINEKNVRSMTLNNPPVFKLLWAIPENSIALLFNGEPWALINAGNGLGYSKGLLRSECGLNVWDQVLFQNTFCRESSSGGAYWNPQIESG